MADTPSSHAAFVPLRVQSAYSMLEGAMRPEDIVALCRKERFPAVALTDRNAMFGAMEFSEKACAQGIQPIMAAFLGVARPDFAAGKGGKADVDFLPLYAQNDAGYANLLKLLFHAYDHDAHTPFVTMTELAACHEGLIALSGGYEGALTRLIAQGQDKAADQWLDFLQKTYAGRLYIEITRLGLPEEAAAEAGLIARAHERDIPLVATNPARFLAPEFHESCEIMGCIADGVYLESEDRRTVPPHAWLKGAQAMADLFADLPEALANSLVVARRCAVMAPSRAPILPSLAGDSGQDEVSLMADAARAGLDQRLAGQKDLSAENLATYRDRLEFEIDVITKMGFAGYFAIVADFIRWAKDNGIAVGPGRGSGAGSAVAWALGITDLDPLRLGLLFERFLNPERVSMPDFDIDFCETRRNEVIDYVVRKYGRDQVAQIVTFGKLKARAVLKDVGRILQMPYGQIDRLAKLIPNNPAENCTLQQALDRVPELATARGDKDVARLFDLAMKLEGLPRHSSTHAAGIVIGDRPLHDLVPVQRDVRSGMVVTQFDMKWVERAGLVKFDFLGLRTLSVIERARALLADRGIMVDMGALDLDDKAVYALLQKGDTVGVFQLESEGMRRTLAAVRPENFGDIIALVSLYRPGPMDNIASFGARKNGRESIIYPHPLLEDILKETYGIFVYQEQVMQAAQTLAGYSLGQADLLRRAMGKKIKAEMDSQRQGFVTGCATNGIDEEKAHELFDLIDKFAGYGFNKSHAAAYAFIAYQTAWLKAHYPVEFYCASMDYEISFTDKLSDLLEDARASGVTCLGPCINQSQARFCVERHMSDKGEKLALRYGLGALKGVGEKAMASLCAERDAHGPFTGLEDMMARVDLRALTRRQLECLAAAGAFDCFSDKSRADIYGLADHMLQVAQKAADERASGQSRLFDEDMDQPIKRAFDDSASAQEARTNWSFAETLTHEREAFGFYFSGHPLDAWAEEIRALGARSFTSFQPPAQKGTGTERGQNRTSATMAVLVEDMKWRASKSGRQSRYLNLLLSDTSGACYARCFDDDLQGVLDAAMQAGDPLILDVDLLWRPDEDRPTITIRQARPLAMLAQRLRTQVEIALEHDPDRLAALSGFLAKYRGGESSLTCVVHDPCGRRLRFLLGRDFALNEAARAALAQVSGVTHVRIARMERSVARRGS